VLNHVEMRGFCGYKFDCSNRSAIAPAFKLHSL
jgi:hypothetical protein